MIELVDEERRGRVVADRDEDAVGRDVADLVGLGVAQAHALDRRLAEDVLDDRIGHELDLRVVAGSLEHDRRGAELVAPVHDRHLARVAGEERRLLHRRVSTADDDKLLVAEEGAVAGGAGRDAATLEPLLTGDAEPACARAGCDDHRVRPVLFTLDPDAERPLGEVDARDVVRDEVDVETLRLAAELRHHLGAHHAVGIPGVVLDVARNHQLAAPVEAFDHQRLEVCPRRVEGCRVPRRAAPDDDQITYVAHANPSSKNSLCPIKRIRSAGRSRPPGHSVPVGRSAGCGGWLRSECSGKGGANGNDRHVERPSRTGRLPGRPGIRRQPLPEPRSEGGADPGRRRDEGELADLRGEPHARGAEELAEPRDARGLEGRRRTDPGVVRRRIRPARPARGRGLRGGPRQPLEHAVAARPGGGSRHYRRRPVPCAARASRRAGRPAARRRRRP